MTELLTREKEFLKLNEQLDKLTTTALEQQLHQAGNNQHHHQTSTGGGGAAAAAGTATSAAAQSNAARNELRFLTYTKAKGQNTLLKKRGAGDGSGCGGDAIIELSPPTNGTTIVKERMLHNNHPPPPQSARNGSDTHRHGISTRHAKQSQHSNTSSTPYSSCARTDDDCGSLPPAEGSVRNGKDGSSTLPSHRRGSIKSPEHSRSYNRTSSGRVVSNTSTFTVKYRNPKFVESPSLEVLVKDESASIRQNIMTHSAPHMATDADSVTSTIAGSTAGSISRRSQASTTTKKQISTEGLIKFLKSKIVILEEDHERISQEMTQQKDLLEKTLERHKKVEEQRDQAYAKHNALSEQLTKVESQLEDSTRRNKERIVEQSSQQKELELVRRELKMLTQTNLNLEKRLYRANEELENTKNALTLMKNAEREMKETMRIEFEGKDKQIKSLKKQRADLLNAYKKQLFLIDNLKRQNICMEQSKMLAFGEKEFTKVLEWNTKS